MNTESENRGPHPEEESNKWGLIVILLFLIGLPILGVLYSMLFGEPPQ